ncbi:MAG: hypothetical protein ACLPSW_31775 [Roseiarcus sp.]
MVVRDRRDLVFRKNGIRGSLKSNPGEGFRRGPLGARGSQGGRIRAEGTREGRIGGFSRQVVDFVENGQGIYLEFLGKAWKNFGFSLEKLGNPWERFGKVWRRPLRVDFGHPRRGNQASDFRH